MPKQQKPLNIVVGSAKGGVGKTTIAAHLAAALNCPLVDLDREGSTRAMRGHDLDIHYAPTPARPRMVLDVPANTGTSGHLSTAVRAATHVIIPMRAGDIELDRFENTLSSIKASVGPGTRVGVILNFARPNALTRDTREALDYLATHGAVPFQVIGTLPDRVAFTRSLTEGMKRTLDLPEFQQVVRWVNA